MEMKNQIEACETSLLAAFGNQDLDIIDELIHDNALFVYPNGLPVTKEVVLENYRSGNSAFSTITPGDQIIHFF